MLVVLTILILKPAKHKTNRAQYQWYSYQLFLYRVVVLGSCLNKEARSESFASKKYKVAGPLSLVTNDSNNTKEGKNKVPEYVNEYTIRL